MNNNLLNYLSKHKIKYNDNTFNYKVKNNIILKYKTNSNKSNENKTKNLKPLISRINVDLINISEKIKEKTENNLTNNNQIIRCTGKLKKEKLTTIKKRLKKYMDLNHNINSINSQILDYSKSFKQKYLYKFNNHKEIRGQFLPNDIKVKYYVNNCLYSELEAKTLSVINRLTFSQLLKKRVTPLKYEYRVKKGLNDVLKSVKTNVNTNKAKLVIIAIDIYDEEFEGGFESKIQLIINNCNLNNIPYYFCCTRKELGYAVYGRKNIRSVKISAVSIINIQGFEKLFLSLVNEVRMAKLKYKNYLYKYIEANKFEIVN